MKQLLEPDPSKRLGHNGFKEIKEHKFFKGVDWENLNKGHVPIIPEIEPINVEVNQENNDKLQKQLSCVESKQNVFKEFDGANFQALSHKNSQQAQQALLKFNKKNKK